MPSFYAFSNTQMLHRDVEQDAVVVFDDLDDKGMCVQAKLHLKRQPHGELP